LASDVFVLASRFEGYGMALAEAIAHGLPVVSTTAGAIPDTIPTGTGLLVPPNDVAALAQSLRRLISDRAERQRLAMNARAAAAQLPTWQESARLFAGAIETAIGIPVAPAGTHYIRQRRHNGIAGRRHDWGNASR
jgi:glycosyltransferase involved in cell wall biosynthesis